MEDSKYTRSEDGTHFVDQYGNTRIGLFACDMGGKVVEHSIDVKHLKTNLPPTLYMREDGEWVKF